MDLKFQAPGDKWMGIIAILLILIVVILLMDTQRNERSIGDKVEDAVEELQK